MRFVFLIDQRPGHRSAVPAIEYVIVITKRT